MAWTEPPTFIADDYGFAHFNTYLRDNILAQGEAQRHLWIDPTEHRDETDGSWSISTDLTAPNHPYGFSLTNSTTGDSIGFVEYLTPGTWEVNVHTAQRNDFGVFSVTVTAGDSPGGAGVEVEQEGEGQTPQVGEFNCYANSGTASYLLAGPFTVSVETAGFYLITIANEQKDIHSGGDTIHIFGIGLQKTADLDTSPVVWTPPKTWVEDEAVGAAELETYVRDALRMSGPFRRRNRIDVFTVAGHSGSTVDLTVNVPLGQYRLLDTQNEYMEWDVVLPAGDISIIVCGGRDTNAGIATVAWDGVDRGTTDFYNGSASTNFRGSAITFTNATPKKAKLRITNATKNASSSGYALGIHCVYIGYDNSAWVDPVHHAARVLTEVADLNNGWRTPMRMRAEMPWIVDIDPIVDPIDSNGLSLYIKDDDRTYFCGRRTNIPTENPGYEGFWIEWDIALAAGTYECTVIGGRAADRGQIDVLLDGTQVVTAAEFYDASGTTSVARTTTGISVATTKTYRVRVQVKTKNASSSGYSAFLNRIRFRRTA